MASTLACGSGGCGTKDSGFVTLDAVARSAQREPVRIARDPQLRGQYLTTALMQIPRILGAIDRNPYRGTYGSLDRAHWHYRTSDFPCQMFQEAVWPLALVYHHSLPGNVWQGSPRLRELIVAALRYAATSSHQDGSCDDYYPYERALGAAVFATNAAAQSYQLLGLDDAALGEWLVRRGQWLIRHNESGRLANHQALAALALARIGQITGEGEFREAARDRIGTVLAWQHAEGWFEEYGGADPGYQTVTLEALAEYQRLTGADWLDGAIARGLNFARCFLHPDGSYGGEYGSRGTYHNYPHGMELLARRHAAAGELAEGFLQGVSRGRHAAFSDDRMYAHWVGSWIEAWIDWSATRVAPPAEQASDSSSQMIQFPAAGLYVHKSPSSMTIVSSARGGTFKHFVEDECVAADAGLIAEFENGQVAATQSHERDAVGAVKVQDQPAVLELSRPAFWVRYETFTPAKFLVFRAGMLTLGRWARDVVRRLLQRRAITGRKIAPLRVTRRFEWGDRLRIIDTIELMDRKRRLRRMHLGVDHHTGYTAAAGAHQQASLAVWRDLSDRLSELHATGRVTIIREVATPSASATACRVLSSR
ncbi:MAG: hypothetical protein K1X71_01315 [Pirellulales bacterium]|nr:hypothetical protein [Pirellulales bacterium]